MSRHEEETPAALDRERIDRVVSIIAGVSRSDASRLIASGAVSIDGHPVQAGKQRVTTGQIIVIDTSRLPDVELPRGDPDVLVDVVYADEHLIVVNKHAGIVVHPGPGHAEGTLVNGLLASFPDIETVGEPHRPGIVHRLDVGTSGLMLVARSDRAYAELTSALRHRQITRDYLGMACGLVADDAGVIEAPVGRDPRDPLKMAVVVSGRPSRTRFHVVERFDHPALTLVRCRLDTGRTHQIRVHLAAVGHPVLGDAAYGGVREGVDLQRPFLHAASLMLSHPATGEDLRFTAEIPPDLASVLESIGPPTTS
jgi:23S rRNA pseudouridine1911/1915/1917 synthase